MQKIIHYEFRKKVLKVIDLNFGLGWACIDVAKMKTCIHLPQRTNPYKIVLMFDESVKC